MQQQISTAAHGFCQFPDPVFSRASIDVAFRFVAETRSIHWLRADKLP
jgi:hypothetical protein